MRRGSSKKKKGETRASLAFWGFDDDFYGIFLSLLDLLKRVPQVVVTFVNRIAKRVKLPGKDGDDLGLSFHGLGH
ncbi:hypothetical protein DITRI_Ditri17bG0016400 [Diplodiscus trichospermus]